MLSSARRMLIGLILAEILRACTPEAILSDLSEACNLVLADAKGA